MNTTKYYRTYFPILCDKSVYCISRQAVYSSKLHHFPIVCLDNEQVSDLMNAEVGRDTTNISLKHWTSSQPFIPQLTFNLYS